MKLENVFKTPEARVKRVFMFIDMTDSTQMKTRQAEVAWIPTLGGFYDSVTEQIDAEENTRIIKFLGDGMMIVFEDRRRGATQAINSAIRIQESLRKSRKAKRLSVSCSIGIAAGDAYMFNVNNQVDFVGAVVDRAARLCSVAAPDAIFIDEDSSDWAAWTDVESPIGKVDDREPRDYRGDPESIELKGFQLAVKYYEVLWYDRRYSVKSKAITEAASKNDEEKLKLGEDLLAQAAELWGHGDANGAYKALVQSADLGNQRAVSEAVNLGVQLYNGGNPDGAQTVWQWAKERGSKAAADYLRQAESN